MMTNFIRELADLIGCVSMSERTEVRVFDEDELRVVFPECSADPVYGGIRMTLGDLEDALTSYNRDDYDCGYTSSLSCSNDMEADDVGSIVLYGEARRVFEENLGLA